MSCKSADLLAMWYKTGLRCFYSSGSHFWFVACARAFKFFTFISFSV